MRRHFQYGQPPLEGGAEELVWKAIGRRQDPGTRFSATNRQKRVQAMVAMLEAEGLHAAALVARPRGLTLT